LFEVVSFLVSFSFDFSAAVSEEFFLIVVFFGFSFSGEGFFLEVFSLREETSSFGFSSWLGLSCGFSSK